MLSGNTNLALLFIACTRLTSAAPSAASVGSDVQILLHNDLYGNESTRSEAVLVLDAPQTQAAAASHCAALGEKLWTPPAGDNDFLSYLSYESGSQSHGAWPRHEGPPGSPHEGPHGGPPGYPHGGAPGWPHGGPWSGEQLYFIAGSSGHGGCQAIAPDGKTTSVNCNAQLPALCTQSAPLSGINNTDTSYQTQVSSGNAVYTGYRDKVSFRFLGIQFASYPERFTYSAPISPSGDISALEFGSICRQIDGITGMNDGSEDCLHINIYTPFLPKPGTETTKLRPVMFWIYGGAFINGYSSDPTFDGGNLASRGDVVVVSINYRLGDFGWLVMGNGTGLNGNYGISDQVSGLQWVHDNIANFGGDPNRVTIFGQSAGAGSVRALLQSPPASGLFSAAILQSDPSPPTYSHYLTIEEEYASQTVAILNATGCTSGNVDAEVACLRAYNPLALVNATTVAANVVVDGKYVITPQIEYNGTGHVNKVPVLLGTMRDDGTPFASSYTNTTNLTMALVNNGFPVAPVISEPQVFALPDTGNLTTAIWNLTARIATEVAFSCLDYATAYAAAQTNTFPEVYYYEFNRSYQIPYWPTAYPVKGLCHAPPDAAHPNGDPSQEYYKCHSGDLMQVFSTWRRWGLPERDSNDTPFTQFVVDTWTSWARSHNPNPDPAYLQARGYVNTTLELKLGDGLWQPVTANSSTQRWLQWPSKEVPLGYEADTQCAYLGQPLNYFLE